MSLDMLYLLIENEVTEDKFRSIMEILDNELIDGNIKNNEIITYIINLYSKINHSPELQIKICEYIDFLLVMYKNLIHYYTSTLPYKNKVDVLLEELKILMDWTKTI